MLTDKQKSAIIGLVSLSATARQLTSRLDNSLVAESDIAELKEKVNQMSELIGSLSEQLEEALHPEAVFTDDQADEFKEAFAKTLAPLPFRIIVSCYGPEYLRPYPRNIRVLICTVLLNAFQARKLTPLPTWNNVLAHNGSLS